MERQTSYIPTVIGKGTARLTTVFNRNDAPSHLFSIPELDFSEDLFAERLGGPWFRLGAWTVDRRRDERGVEEEVSRQSILLTSEGFESVFDKLESVGNVTLATSRIKPKRNKNSTECRYRWMRSWQRFHSITIQTWMRK